MAASTRDLGKSGDVVWMEEGRLAWSDKRPVFTLSLPSHKDLAEELCEEKFEALPIPGWDRRRK